MTQFNTNRPGRNSGYAEKPPRPSDDTPRKADAHGARIKSERRPAKRQDPSSN